MKQIIGYLKDLEVKLFAKDANGIIRPLQFGNPVYKDEIVVDESGAVVQDVLQPLPTQTTDEIIELDDANIFTDIVDNPSHQKNASIKLGDFDHLSDEANIDAETREDERFVARSTTSTDTFERSRGELDISIGHRHSSFFYENTGHIRGEANNERNIDAPLRSEGHYDDNLGIVSSFSVTTL